MGAMAVHDMSTVGGHVLVVDDEAVGRDLMVSILRRQGYRISEAIDGREALDAIRLDPPDLVLLDVSMPRMDGIEVCTRLKGDETTSFIPVLIVTGAADRENRLAAIRAGANDFLSKTSEPEEIALRVRNALAMRQMFDHLRDDRDRLRELRDMKDCLVHVIAGELSSLLRVTAGYLELLKSDGKTLSSRQTEYVHQSLSMVNLFSGKIATLLQLAQMEYARMPLKREESDVRVLAGTVAEDLLRTNGVALSIVTEEGDTHVSCDPDVIKRVLEFLVNTLMFDLSDGGNVNIHIFRSRGALRVAVSSKKGATSSAGSGQIDGVSPNELEICAHSDPFARLELAYCKLAVEAHGGRLGCEREGVHAVSWWFELDTQQEP